MAFDPATYVTLAQELHGQSSQDGAALRAGISRAYYGAFLMARNHYDIDSKAPDGHKLVSDRYQANARNPSCKIVSDALVALKRMRVQADYMDTNACTVKQGENAIELANKVLKLLPSIPKPSA